MSTAAPIASTAPVTPAIQPTVAAVIPPEFLRPPDAVLLLLIRAHEAAANALAVMQTVMKSALANPTEKLPGALNQARIAAAQVLRFASRIITPPAAPATPPSTRAPRPPATLPASDAPAAKLQTAAGTVPAAQAPVASPAVASARPSSATVTQMIRDFIARTGDAPARPAPTTPPPGSTAPTCRSQ